MDVDCYRGSCRQPVVCGLNSSVAIELEFMVFNNFHMIFLLAWICVPQPQFDIRWKQTAFEVLMVNLMYLDLKMR